MSESEIALRVEGLSKRYRLGLQENASGGMYRYKSLRHSFGSIAKAPLQTLKSAFVKQPMDDDNSFWALKDINFEVKRGEVVGIIGRNGAGKSTLLKILSQITKPTTGRVDLFGRVGSLLEVGTGFHPELTGRENIYLNGAILGMTKAEVKAKFDEIVAFSEVEKFLDMAVKQYSSGMYMRLAFAVAAHLEPEILVVDEVLAVGDAAFQKKCLGKMKDVADEGRTVLFVSHNMPAIITLCDSAIMLVGGTLKRRGTTAEAATEYICESDTLRGTYRPQNHRNNKLSVEEISIRTLDGGTATSVSIQSDFDISITFRLLSPLPSLRFTINILSADGTTAFTTKNWAAPSTGNPGPQLGKYRTACRIPSNLLNDGRYIVSASADVPFVEILFSEDQALSFNVLRDGGAMGILPERWPGVVCPKIAWSAEPFAEDVARL